MAEAVTCADAEEALRSLSENNRPKAMGDELNRALLEDHDFRRLIRWYAAGILFPAEGER